MDSISTITIARQAVKNAQLEEAVELLQAEIARLNTALTQVVKEDPKKEDSDG